MIVVNQANDLPNNNKRLLTQPSLILIGIYGKREISSIVILVGLFLAENTWGVLKLGLFQGAP